MPLVAFGHIVVIQELAGSFDGAPYLRTLDDICSATLQVAVLKKRSFIRFLK